ncbi:hypothetical protein J5X84_33530 [Streptosporangiaceae bacterium NEAU-GS5]|nr:hypothetical protein [Streptosporangiaceae bacterium NEAU-GS5]
MSGGGRELIVDARYAAGLLRAELYVRHRIEADLNAGQGMAVVSVWAGLVVWSNGRWFWWSVGRISSRRRLLYTICPASDVPTAARWVARRYAVLRREQTRAQYVQAWPQ